MKKSIILLLLLVLTTALTAQQTDTINFLLQFQKKLDLNQDQIKKMKAMELDLKRYCIKTDAKYKLGEVELKELKQDPAKNLKLIEKKYQEQASVKADREFAPLKAYVEAVALLTPEQQNQFTEIRESFHHMDRFLMMPEKENVYYYGEGKVWVEEEDKDEIPEAVYEFKTGDGKGGVWNVKKNVYKDEKGNITVDFEKEPESGKHHAMFFDDSGKEMKYDVYVTQDKEGEKTVKILKKIGEGEKGKTEKIILEDADVDKIMDVRGDDGDKKIVKVRIKEGDKELTEIKELEDEDIEKILEEHPGESIMIIKHADGKTEVIKGLKAIEEKEKELKDQKGEKKAGQKVIVKKVKEEEK